MNPTKRIALILIAIFLLPALFFSVYEISSLNKDERVIEDIYKKQLETILFSVNQYSDDALSRWISKIEIGIERNDDNNFSSTMQSLLSLNSSIHSVFLIDSVNQKTSTHIFSLLHSPGDSLRLEIEERLLQNATQIQQLIKYKKSGFQKTEVSKYPWKASGNFQLLFFIVESSRGQRVAGLLINPNAFIEDMVGPKLQTIAKDQFILSAFDKTSGRLVYSTLQNDTVSLSSFSLSKDFWIFPDFALGIRTQGASLKQIVRDRTNTNLILLVGLDVVLIIALVLAFRNVKKEVQLAQNKADFVSNVSHEIRTPLALISMFAETLEMGRVQSEEKNKNTIPSSAKKRTGSPASSTKFSTSVKPKPGKKHCTLNR